MNPSTVPESNSFAARNREFERSHADTENIENKKGFRGSRLVKPIKNAVRYIADGIRTAFRNIRSFLITACSPSCSCFRKGKSAASGQKPPSSVEKNAGLAQRDISSRQVEPHEQPALAGPVSQCADKPSILPGRVKLVSSDQGIEGFIKRQAFENPYGVVNSIDTSGELLSGVGCVIKRLAGDDYARATMKKQQSADPSDRLNYGQCSTHDFVREGWNRPESSDIKEWRTIHDVLVPSASEPDFETHLKNSFLMLFNEAADRELEHIVLPMLGCDQAGGTGGRLARALFAAARKFEARHPHSKMPEMILVGTPSLSGTQARADFESEWEALISSVARQAPDSRIRQSDASTPSDISSGAAARLAPLSSGETLAVPPSVGAPEHASTAGADAMLGKAADRAFQVDAASSQVDVASGVITLPNEVKVLISNHGIADFINQKGFKKPYGVVNSIDRSEELLQGIGCVIKQLAGNDYAQATRKKQSAIKVSERLNYGKCVACDFRRDKLNRSSGLDDKCRVIYNVLVPDEGNPDFVKHLKNSFLMILETNQLNETHCIVFPVLGCGRAGENGHQLAQAIFDARREFASKHPGRRLPEMVLVGTDSDGDRQACTRFADEWKTLHNQQKVSGQPVTAPSPTSRTCQSGVTTSSDISSGAAARPVHLPSRETFGNLSSDLRSISPVVPKSAFPAKAGEITGKYTGQGSHVKTALTRAAPRAQLYPVISAFQNTHEPTRALTIHRALGSIVHPVILVFNADLKQLMDGPGGGRQGDLEGQNRKAGEVVYGAVCPVDESGELRDGAAGVVKDMVGGQYAIQAVREVQNNLPGSMEYGHAVCYGCPSGDASCQLSGLRGLHSVYGVRIPPSADHELFDDKLRGAILNVLSLAVENKITRLVFPLLGCDKKTGGTGGQMAEALHSALSDFQSRYPDARLPKVFLLGADMGVLADGCQVVEEFRHQWVACERLYKERRSARKKPELSDPFDSMLRISGGVAGTGIKAAIKASAETVTETVTSASAETATEASAGAVTRADQCDGQSD